MSVHEAERLRIAPRHALPDARRADPRQLAREVQLVGESSVVSALLEAVDATLLVLNSHRQVVAFNGRRDRDGVSLAGLRPGEVLACVNARSPGGCGTTVACETCGALGAILGCERSGRSVDAQCVISTEIAGTALEFSVRATPIQLEHGRFTVVALRDVSGERRREALEQIFFHDVLNTVAGLRGWATHIRGPGANLPRASERIDVLSRQLEREIRDHRSLVLAESGALVPEWATVRVKDVLEELEGVFSHHPAARDRSLSAAPVPPDLALETDPALLARVLVNMVRNAFEATEPAGTVRLACEVVAGATPAAVRFTVHNGGCMPPEVQARVFQRSFSTKAARGRGLGTYGMKLLGERYLGGEVSFESTPDAGTTFAFRVPIVAPRSAAPSRRPGVDPALPSA